MVGGERVVCGGRYPSHDCDDTHRLSHATMLYGNKYPFSPMPPHTSCTWASVATIASCFALTAASPVASTTIAVAESQWPARGAGEGGGGSGGWVAGEIQTAVVLEWR